MDLSSLTMPHQNIGYNQAGVLKLFNFSKAQSLSKKHSTNKPHDTSLFTKAVYHGTRPYAAPEIAVKLPCNISVDTYAYAIVLWEIMSLKLCFGREMKASTFSTILEDVYDEKVEKRNQRPKFEKDTPKALQDIIKHCWSTDPKNRPSMKAVHSDLINYRDQLKMIM
jgi:serine/threonine protein kinase